MDSPRGCVRAVTTVSAVSDGRWNWMGIHSYPEPCQSRALSYLSKPLIWTICMGLSSGESSVTELI